MSQHFRPLPPVLVAPDTIAAPTGVETTRLSAMARRLGGLNIDPGKVDFFRQRLTKRLQQTGKADFKSYCAFLESDAGRSEHKALIEALTTHTTSFFREQKHFDWLAQVGWRSLIDGGAGLEWTLRVWSAACSTGAELYSTLIAFQEFSQKSGQHYRIDGVGTDLSAPILRKAEQAVYSAQEIGGLSEPRRRAFVLRARDGSDRFRIVPELRRQTSWSRLNLTDIARDGPGLADLILLRNVLIYFDPPTQKRVVADLAARLRPNGVLMTGHSESLSALPDGMVQAGAAIYRKVG